MEISFYFYTILIMLVCIVAGSICLSAYFVSRKISYLYATSFFLFYFLDLALIFQYEYLEQNVSYQLDTFYVIDHPLVKTLFAVGVMESLWLIIGDYLDERRVVLKVMPGILFVATSLLLASLAPDGPLKQWCFYGLRQVFLIWCLCFSLFRYRRAKTEVDRVRMRRQRLLFIFTVVLTFCILAEDTFMILVWNPTAAAAVSLLPLYISERNFSENFLMVVFASVALREGAETLRLRSKEPPESDNPALQQHIDGLLPCYSQRHGLTVRESVVLELVLLGKDNQNIASELQLAVGTMKAHVHNILKKTGYASRYDLARDFWRE